MDGKVERSGEDRRARRLCEGEPSLVVHLEDLLDGADVGSGPQVQPQVVFVGDAHDLLQKNKAMKQKSDLHSLTSSHTV